MTHETKNLVVIPVIALGIAFWLLAAVGASRLLAEVNTIYYPRRFNLLGALFMNHVPASAKRCQNYTRTGLVGFVSCLIICGIVSVFR